MTAATVGDAYTRWWNVLWGWTGYGLRGGTYRVHGPYLSWSPLPISFHDVRFTEDVAVDGRVTWNRRAGHMRGLLHIEGPNGISGRPRLHADTTMNDDALLVGRIDGNRVRVRTPLPFQP